ncbi:MAG: hypothetical protein GX209_04410, partial [Epulopiscium sp.]|nr:hypothetical protein [Candidatus Epulonipiscium sp.]
GENHLDREVFLACGSDLMSDVLAFVKEKVILLTGLVNPQVVRTAEMMDIKAIVFVRGKKVSQDVLELAESKNMVILATQHPLYISCGLLYSNGLTGKELKAEDSHEA